MKSLQNIYGFIEPGIGFNSELASVTLGLNTYLIDSC